MRASNQTVSRALATLVPCALFLTPLSCGDDSNGSTSSDASSDAPADSPGADSAPHADGATTMTGSDAGQKESSSAEAQAAVDGGAPDGSLDADAAPVTCPAPADPTKAQVCLVFDPEVVKVESSNQLLDGKGQLLIQIFDTSMPGSSAQPIVPAITYPEPDDAGSADASVYALPVIPVDGLPSSVYILTTFVDNSLWLQTKQGFTYGLFVGGMDLSGGIGSTPPLQPVSLTPGQGTVVTQHLTAFRRFQTKVVLGPSSDGGAVQPAGNGQGPLSVSVYEQSMPNPPIYGMAQYPCVDIVNRSPFAVTGFFYNGASGSVPAWFYGQVDDFGVGGTNPGGALVSLTAPGGAVPDSQKVTVAPDQYDVLLGDLPQVTLTTILPSAPATDSANCSSGGTHDGGTDAPPG